MQTAEIAAFHTTMPAQLASDLAGFAFLTRREPPLFYASDRMIFSKARERDGTTIPGMKP